PPPASASPMRDRRRARALPSCDARAGMAVLKLARGVLAFQRAREVLFAALARADFLATRVLRAGAVLFAALGDTAGTAAATNDLNSGKALGNTGSALGRTYCASATVLSAACFTVDSTVRRVYASMVLARFIDASI